jgi:hypothetical protein
MTAEPGIAAVAALEDVHRRHQEAIPLPAMTIDHQ